MKKRRYGKRTSGSRRPQLSQSCSKNATHRKVRQEEHDVDDMTEQRQDPITQEQAMISQSHPSHAAGGACWRGGRRVAVRRHEQLGVSSQGAKDLPQGLAEEIFASSDRTRRWTCLLRETAQAREEHKTPTETGSTRHVDRSINSSMSASRSAR